VVVVEKGRPAQRDGRKAAQQGWLLWRAATQRMHIKQPAQAAAVLLLLFLSGCNSLAVKHELPTDICLANSTQFQTGFKDIS